MGLKLRLDTEEHVLRSVGDPPNGIVTFGWPKGGDPTWLVNPSYQPPTVPDDMTGVLVDMHVGGQAEAAVEASTEITASEVVAGCDGDRVLVGQLLTVTASIMVDSMKIGLARHDMAFVVAHCKWYDQFLRALVEHGYATERGDDE